MNFIHLPDEDLVLWNQFRQGSESAFEQLTRIHYKDLYNYGTRFVKDKELVKDCLQDLFLTLWKNRLTINETSFVKYYLLKSLRRKLKRAINKNRKFGIRQELYFNSTAFDPALLVDNDVVLTQELADQAVKIRSLITHLSKRQQEIIYLRFYMDADVDEIAEIMTLSRQSVYNLIHDALKKLRNISAPSPLDFSLQPGVPTMVIMAILKYL